MLNNIQFSEQCAYLPIMDFGQRLEFSVCATCLVLLLDCTVPNKIIKVPHKLHSRIPPQIIQLHQ